MDDLATSFPSDTQALKVKQNVNPRSAVLTSDELYYAKFNLF